MKKSVAARTVIITFIVTLLAWENAIVVVCFVGPASFPWLTLLILEAVAISIHAFADMHPYKPWAKRKIAITFHVVSLIIAIALMVGYNFP